MHAVPVLQLLLLLAAANGAPVLGKRLLRDRFAWPVDFGLRLFDGRPLFGMSKTWRGLVLALAAVAALAPAIGLDGRLGLCVGALAMAGDLLSSFLKRRLGLAPSSMALGLDQIPESLLPLAVVAWTGSLPLNVLDVAAGTILFLVGELAASRVLYRLGIRDRPY